MLLEVNSGVEARMVSRLAEMQKSGDLCDFDIKSGNQSVKAHKCVLAAALEYFQTSFNFSETCQKDTSIDLSHLGCDISIIGKVIHSLYSNEIDLEQDNVQRVLLLADYLLHKELTLCVERFLENTLALHNAIFYFKLCVQFDLREYSTFGNARRLLRGRMHDFLIYQPETLTHDKEVLAAVHSYGLLSNCSPLQVMAFFLSKLNHDATSRHNSDEEGLLPVICFLETYFLPNNTHTSKRWKPYLRQYLSEWLLMNRQQYVENKILLQKLENLLHMFSPGGEEACEIEVGDSGDAPCSPGGLSSVKERHKPSPNRSREAATDSNSSKRNTRSSSAAAKSAVSKNGRKPKCPKLDTATTSSRLIPSSTEMDNDSGQALAFEESLQQQQQHYDQQHQQQSEQQQQTPLIQAPSLQMEESQDERNKGVGDIQNLTHLPKIVIDKDELCQTLIVLAPSAEMASQLMEIEAGKVRPLLKSPKLCLHFYDIQLQIWKEGITLDFPISGHMQEKHSWRVAFAKGNLYVFSLMKKIGLEYNLHRSTWSHLSCAELFKSHVNSSDQEFPVKNIIPAAVGDELVILSMSREPRPDGSFITQQHFYQLDQASKTFQHVNMVEDERMDLPATQWTVEGDELYTAKACTIWYHELPIYNVQCIHVYNSKTRRLKTHSIQSILKSGLKVLVRSGKLYLVNNFGEFMRLDLATSVLGERQNIANPAFTTNVNASFKVGDEIYPALHRSSCHAGSSRWTMSVMDSIGSASLQEMHVSEEEEFGISFHPSPPFLHLTAMCSATVKRDDLDSMRNARFNSSEQYSTLMNV